MTNEPESIYLPTDQPGVYESTQLANAGWYDEGQHGGAVTALLAAHLENVPTLTEMEVSRITVEIFRVIKIEPLRIETEIVREGKRIQTVVARIFSMDGTLLSLANIQRLRRSDLELPSDSLPPALSIPNPDESDDGPAGAFGPGSDSKVMFHRSAIELRQVEGGFGIKGPGTAWFRLKKTILAGTQVTPLQRAVAAADFVNGLSASLDLRSWVFMNPDLTVHLSRYPRGEWIALSAESTYQETGRGMAAGTLWDAHGLIGRSAQTLYLDLVDNM